NFLQVKTIGTVHPETGGAEVIASTLGGKPWIRCSVLGFFGPSVTDYGRIFIITIHPVIITLFYPVSSQLTGTEGKKSEIVPSCRQVNAKFKWCPIPAGFPKEHIILGVNDTIFIPVGVFKISGFYQTKLLSSIIVIYFVLTHKKSTAFQSPDWIQGFTFSILVSILILFGAFNRLAVKISPGHTQGPVYATQFFTNPDIKINTLTFINVVIDIRNK